MYQILLTKAFNLKKKIIIILKNEKEKKKGN